MPTLHCREVSAWAFQLGSYKQAVTTNRVSIHWGRGAKSDPLLSSGRQETQQRPTAPPGRCPWCCRILGRPCALPAGSCGDSPNVKQTGAPHLTFNTNDYPGLSSLSPSRRLQIGHSSKTLFFFFFCITLSSSPPALRQGGGGGKGGLTRTKRKSGGGKKRV